MQSGLFCALMLRRELGLLPRLVPGKTAKDEYTDCDGTRLIVR